MSKVSPAALVGVTVTLVPSTLTSRKWWTWSVLVGAWAAPQAPPVLVVPFQPMP